MSKETQSMDMKRRASAGHMPGASVEDMAASDVAAAIHKARAAGMCDKCIADILAEFRIKGRAK